MSKVLEALDRIAYTNGYDNDIAIIEKELKALEIINDKNVNVWWLKISPNLSNYNSAVGDNEALKYEEYILLKVVLGNE